MSAGAVIRRAEMADLAQLTDIYNHYILHTPITFDIEPKTQSERREWLEQFAPVGRHQCFVAEDKGRVLGWACSGPYRPKAAYQTSVEFSIYLAPDIGGRGLGHRLYVHLIDALKGADVHRALAGITLPNEASVALHRKFGFADVGIYSEVGRKFDLYWDVLWMARKL